MPENENAPPTVSNGVEPNARRPRIVHFYPSIRLSEGGVIRAVMDLCSVIAARGTMDVALLTCDSTDAPGNWKDAGAERVPHIIEMPRFGAFDRLPADSLEIARKNIENASVLHLHGPWLSSNAQLAAIARELSVPYIVSIHGMLDDWSMSQRTLKKRAYLLLKGNAFLKGAARLHCTAQGELEQASKWIDRSRAVVLPLVFDVAPYRELPGPEIARKKFLEGQPTTKPILLFVGRIHEKKGIELLIDAAALLRNRGRACEVIIAGTGDEAYVDSLRLMCKQRGLESSVRFVGLVKGAEKVSLYQLADVFVLPTSQENFGLVLPEAMASGTPVVTTKGVDIWPELEAHGATIIALRNANAIAEAVDKLLADKSGMKERAERGRAWVMNELNPDRVAEKYEQLYQAVMSQRGHTAL